ncbi:MAG: 6,7-dimethyl-8-ribityllumazine synthase [Bacteroidales bacterium]|nr:6,7-dimethyl-8-ribityllumazine synthase [Bacteroidales bacterium]
MATEFHITKESDAINMPTPERVAQQRFGIVVADWNSNITYALLDGALNTLRQYGAVDNNIIVTHVPGTFELTYGAKHHIEHHGVDAVIIIGCVVRGDTPHFDYICQGVTVGAAQLNAEGKAPVVFGVLTTENMQQAEDRAGGCLGNKGAEAAIVAIRMANID